MDKVLGAAVGIIIVTLSRGELQRVLAQYRLVSIPKFALRISRALLLRTAAGLLNLLPVLPTEVRNSADSAAS